MSGSTVIDNYVFAASRGAITLPQRTATRFATSTAVNAGAQLTPPTGQPFALDLTKYVAATNGQDAVDYHLDRIGRLAFFESNGIRYWQSPYRYLFLVLNVEILESKAVARACGHAGGVAFDFSPGWVVRSRWTLQAVRQ
jgi:hypothetical protein